MPKLDTKMHVNMFKGGKRRLSLSSRIKKAINVLRTRSDVYGLEWGDPEVVEPLCYVREHFLTPYISPSTTLVEIGPGGGRWTRYMLGAKKIYAVDYHQELLDELKKNFSNDKNILYIKNNGDDFPGIPSESIDFIFSFGCFVHLDIDIIDRYLGNIKPLLESRSNVVIQYSQNQANGKK